jgi:ribonuclease BN (tRNA processing enzyme)
MKLTILGSGYFIPTKTRNNSGYLLEIADELILLDSGSGVLRQYLKTDHSLWDISKIFYSHLHLDHIADLLPILFTRKYSEQEDRVGSELLIFAHKDFSPIIEGYENMFGQWITNEKFPYSFRPIEPGNYSFTTFELKVIQGNHSVQSLMYCFKDSTGKLLLYASDTDLSEELILASKGVDLLVIECSCSDTDPEPGHMNPAKIATLIQEAKPKITLLTHLSPENDTAKLLQKIKIPTECLVRMAEDFLIMEI